MIQREVSSAYHTFTLSGTPPHATVTRIRMQGVGCSNEFNVMAESPSDPRRQTNSKHNKTTKQRSPLLIRLAEAYRETESN